VGTAEQVAQGRLQVEVAAPVTVAEQPPWAAVERSAVGIRRALGPGPV